MQFLFYYTRVLYGSTPGDLLSYPRGFIKVLNRRATEFDTRAKNWQDPPLGGIRGHAPPENFEIL